MAAHERKSGLADMRQVNLQISQFNQYLQHYKTSPDQDSS